MHYIIFDLEWNQADKKQNEDPKLPFEIIEIGAIKLNENFEKIGEFSRLIRPSVYHTMHAITQDIIHISMSELKREQTFTPVMRYFLKWCGEECVYGTWGSLDLTELQRNMDYYHFPPLSDGPLTYLDVQKLYALVYEPEDDKKRRSLKNAVEQLGITQDIPFHRAFADAYYTAKVLQRISAEPSAQQLLKRVSYDVYRIPKTRKQEVHIIFDTYAKYISREFEDKQAAMEDREVASTRCYICHKNCRKKLRWFTPNGRHYYALACCNKHGYIKGKIRMKKTEGDKVYVVKTLKLIDEEQAKTVQEKQEHAREIRRQHRRAKHEQKAHEKNTDVGMQGKAL